MLTVSLTIPFLLLVLTFMEKVLNGSLKVGDDSKVHQAFHTIVLSAGADENGVNLEAMEDGTEICLVS